MQFPVPTARMSLREMYDIGVCVVGGLTVDRTNVETLYHDRAREHPLYNSQHGARNHHRV